MASGDAHVDRVDLTTRHQFCFLYRALYRVDGRLDVDHDALLHAPGGMRANAHHLHATVGINLSDNGNYLRGANIKPHDHLLAVPIGHYSSPLFCTACIASPASLNVTAAPCSYRRSTFATACAGNSSAHRRLNRATR